MKLYDRASLPERSEAYLVSIIKREGTNEIDGNQVAMTVRDREGVERPDGFSRA